jgi:hypothetical protein
MLTIFFKKQNNLTDSDYEAIKRFSNFLYQISSSPIALLRGIGGISLSLSIRFYNIKSLILKWFLVSQAVLLVFIGIWSAIHV